MSGSFSTSETDVIEMSYPTRGGNLSCERHRDPIMNSCISNEHGINLTLITMMSLLNIKLHQKSSPCIYASSLMFPVALIDIAISPHEEHNGMTKTLLTACKETCDINPLWLTLITLHMLPPQKQTPPNLKSFDIQYIHICIYCRGIPHPALSASTYARHMRSTSVPTLDSVIYSM